MVDNNDLILLDIGGRKRQLRFNHSALKLWAAETGKSAGEFNPRNMTPDSMELVLYCMLQTEAAKRQEDVTREQVAEWMDDLILSVLYNKIVSALVASFPEPAGPQKPAQGKGKPAQGKKPQTKK